MAQSSDGLTILLDSVLTGLPWDMLRRAKDVEQAKLLVQYLEETNGIMQVPVPQDVDRALRTTSLPLLLFFAHSRLVSVPNPLRSLPEEHYDAVFSFFGINPRRTHYVMHFASTMSDLDDYVNSVHSMFTMNTMLPAISTDLASVLACIKDSAYNETPMFRELRTAGLLIVRFPFGIYSLSRFYGDTAAALFESRRQRGYMTVFAECLSDVYDERSLATFISSRKPTSRLEFLLFDPSVCVTHSMPKSGN